MFDYTTFWNSNNHLLHTIINPLRSKRILLDTLVKFILCRTCLIHNAPWAIFTAQCISAHTRKMNVLLHFERQRNGTGDFVFVDMTIFNTKILYENSEDKNVSLLNFEGSWSVNLWKITKKQRVTHIKLPLRHIGQHFSKQWFNDKGDKNVCAFCSKTSAKRQQLAQHVWKKSDIELCIGVLKIVTHPNNLFFTMWRT